MDTAHVSWRERLEAVHAFVQTHRESSLIRAAGKWIDTEYSEEAVRARRNAAVMQPAPGSEHARVGSSPPMTLPLSAFAIPGDDEGKDTRFWRLHALEIDLRNNAECVDPMSLEDPVTWGARMLLLACLATDRDADEYLGNVSELSALSWEGDCGFGRGWNDCRDLRAGTGVWPTAIEHALRAVKKQLQGAWEVAQEAAFAAMQPYEARLRAMREQYPNGWTPGEAVSKEHARLVEDKSRAQIDALAKHGFVPQDTTIKSPAKLLDHIDERMLAVRIVRGVARRETDERRLADIQSILDEAADIIGEHGWDIHIETHGSPSEKLARLRRELRSQNQEHTAALRTGSEKAPVNASPPTSGTSGSVIMELPEIARTLRAMASAPRVQSVYETAGSLLINATAQGALDTIPEAVGLVRIHVARVGGPNYFGAWCDGVFEVRRALGLPRQVYSASFGEDVQVIAGVIEKHVAAASGSTPSNKAERPASNSAASTTNANESEVEPEDPYLSETDLAARFGVSQDSLRTKLRNWRPNHMNNDWIEVKNKRPNDPKYIYRLSSVRYIIDQLPKTGR